MTLHWHFIEFRNISEKVIHLLPHRKYKKSVNLSVYSTVMPMIVERRSEVENLQHDLQGRCYDLEYSLRYSTNNNFFLIDWIDNVLLEFQCDKVDWYCRWFIEKSSRTSKKFDIPEATIKVRWSSKATKYSEQSEFVSIQTAFR